MTVKLRSAATGDLVLLSATAKELLGLLGKQADRPGIIEPSDMSAALATLQALKAPAKDHVASAAPSDDDKPVAFSDESVSQHQRAWPLIQMIEKAQAADKPIVWGV